MGIQVGPGRGSAAGALVAYALRITDIDPIEHGLLFERFLNPERASMPDIDIDFDRRRGKMVRYAAEKWGSDRVAQVITFGTIKTKAALKDAAGCITANRASPSPTGSPRHCRRRSWPRTSRSRGSPSTPMSATRRPPRSAA